MYYHDAKAGSKQPGIDPKLNGKPSTSSPDAANSQRTTALDWFTAITGAVTQFAPGNNAQTFQPSAQSIEPGQVSPPVRSSMVTPVLGVVGGLGVLGLVIWAVRRK